MRTRNSERRDWTAEVWRCNRAERFGAFRRVARYLSDQEFWRVLGEVYQDAEDRTVKLLLLDMMQSSRRPGREMLMNDEERAVLGAMPEDLLIWRGDVDGKPPGWSWTLQREKAEWFARRWELFQFGKPRLLRGVCAKAEVIAYFTQRKETEIVVDPDRVRDVREEALT